MNKYDIWTWIKKVIDSCEDFRQWVKCIKLIQRFEKLYPDKDLWGLGYQLRQYHNVALEKLYPKTKIIKPK